MPYTIPELLESRKAKDGAVLLSILLLGVVSFGLGRLSGLSASTQPVALCADARAAAPQALVAGVENGPIATSSAAAGSYVASKTGTAYYFPWCAGAARIKDSNKIWFTTKEDAEAAGYKPASTCKGL